MKEDETIWFDIKLPCMCLTWLQHKNSSRFDRVGPKIDFMSTVSFGEHDTQVEVMTVRLTDQLFVSRNVLREGINVHTT